MNNTNMKKRMTILVIALIIVCGGLIGFNLFRSFMIKRFIAHYEPPAVSVASVVAKEKNWYPRIAAVGNFIAIQGVDINAEVSGKIVDIHFASGQFIEKDKPLIDIDDNIEQATLKFNESELTLQAINYKRQEDLFKRGATPGSSVDEAKAKLLQAQANVEKIQATINQKHIVAPFSGQLGIRQINIGQYVSPGQTPIVTLQALDPLYLDFYLPEQLLSRLHINQTITFSVEQNLGLLFTGKITAINSKADVNTHNIQIRATVPNCPTKAMADPSHSSLVKVKKMGADEKTIVLCDTQLNKKNKIVSFNFIPGMFAAIDVDEPATPHVVVLPTTAISYSLYGDSVFLIEKDKTGKKDKDGRDILRVKRVFIDAGEQRGNYTVIKKGIKAGQTVVASGELKLENDTRVTINNDIQLKETVNINTLGE